MSQPQSPWSPEGQQRQQPYPGEQYGSPGAQPPRDPRQPPGWYPDPGGMQVLRWWDGTRWGSQTQPFPPQAPVAQGSQPGPQVTAVRQPGKRRTVVKAIIGVVAAGVILLVIDGVLSHIGSDVGGSSSACTSNSCIAQHAKQSLTGVVAKDESVITAMTCDTSTVKNPDPGVYTVSCLATYSDGSQWDGIASVLVSQDKSTWEPTQEVQ